MDTLFTDLLLLIADQVSLEFYRLLPGVIPDEQLISKYIQQCQARIIKRLEETLPPKQLAVIKKYNLAISGSFVLKSLYDQNLDWTTDLDIIVSESVLNNEIINTLEVYNNPSWIDHYGDFGCIQNIMTNNFHWSEKRIDLIILKSHGTIDDLLNSYDFDFVKNSFEFLPGGGSRLKIHHLPSVYNKIGTINFDNYGIEEDGLSDIDVSARISRLISRITKYKERGFKFLFDQHRFDVLSRYITKFAKVDPYVLLHATGIGSIRMDQNTMLNLVAIYIDNLLTDD